MRLVDGVVEEVLDLLFPPICAGCRRRNAELGFCDRCRESIDTAPEAICPRCGRAYKEAPNHLCSDCLGRAPAYARARACGTYSRSARDAPLARAIHGLKYERDASFAAPLAQLVATSAPSDRTYDSIVPVPLHIKRLRWRGFNQAVLLARTYSRQSNQSLDCMALLRVRPTPPQVGLREKERRQNIRGAFRINPAWNPRGRRVLLLDDVYTTGATVDECSRVLLAGGADRVDVLTLARAV